VTFSPTTECWSCLRANLPSLKVSHLDCFGILRRRFISSSVPPRPLRLDAIWQLLQSVEAHALSPWRRAHDAVCDVNDFLYHVQRSYAASLTKSRAFGIHRAHCLAAVLIDEAPVSCALAGDSVTLTVAGVDANKIQIGELAFVSLYF